MIARHIICTIHTYHILSGRSARQALRRPSRSPGKLLALNDLKSTLKCYNQRQKGPGYILKHPIHSTHSSSLDYLPILSAIFQVHAKNFQLTYSQSAHRIGDFFFLNLNRVPDRSSNHGRGCTEVGSGKVSEDAAVGSNW